MIHQTVREYLDNPDRDHCFNFFDWFCRDSSLKNKQITLDKKVRKLVASTKIDMDSMRVWYKNNCPINGNLYDDIRFSDMETGKNIFCIVPCSGHDSRKGVSEVWGASNEFKEPLVRGTWKDVLKFFNVK